MASDMAKSRRFAVACSLLGQYIREKSRVSGDVGGFGVARRAVPTTMSLMPGAHVEAAEQPPVRQREEEMGVMELFPQRAGFEADEDEVARAREPDKSQLTIFYDGRVLVFDDFPTEKAKDLMQLAGNSSIAVTKNLPNVHPTFPETSDIASADAPTPAKSDLSYMPIARKASLQRFLEKRKDRLSAKAPYRAPASSVTDAACKKDGRDSWLGLAPIDGVNSELSLGSNCSQ